MFRSSAVRRFEFGWVGKFALKKKQKSWEWCMKRNKEIWGNMVGQDGLPSGLLVRDGGSGSGNGLGDGFGGGGRRCGPALPGQSHRPYRAQKGQQTAEHGPAGLLPPCFTAGSPAPGGRRQGKSAGHGMGPPEAESAVFCRPVPSVPSDTGRNVPGPCLNCGKLLAQFL